MRQIKFRGMDVNGVMRYGQLSQDKPNSTLYYEKCSQRICWDNSNIPVTNESLGQFTGLLDKNGKEIYEGDINMDYDLRKSEVVFYSGGFYLKYSKTEYKHIGATTEFDRGIIGNIYENPELLVQLDK